MARRLKTRKQINHSEAGFISPMRPHMVPKLPADTSKWLYEPKLDGYRAIAVRKRGASALYSMDGKSFNERFSFVLQALNRLNVKDVVLDGELVAVEPSGRPKFNELQNSARTKLPIHFVVFDILHLDGTG